VLSAYDYACAVCGFALRQGNEPVALEAAHIKWHEARGPDLVRNALSLCALHHRLFDKGAFAVSPGMRVIVAKNVTGSGFEEALGRFRAKAAIDGVKWSQNGQVENVPFAGRRRVCAKALGREEDVNSMISRRRCIEEDLTFKPAANQHFRTGVGKSAHASIKGTGRAGPQVRSLAFPRGVRFPRLRRRGARRRSG